MQHVETRRPLGMEDAIKGFVSTPASQLFFSARNMALLQQGLRNMVLNKSSGKYRISDQSEAELLSIMRAVYLQHSRNTPDCSAQAKQEVRELNTRVLAFAVPRILNEIEMYMTYKRDREGPTFFDRPQSTSVAGTKVLNVAQ